MAAFTPMGVIATVKNLGAFQRDLNKMAGSMSSSNSMMNKLSKGATASMVSAFTDVAGAVVNIGKAAVDAALKVGKLAYHLGKDAFDAAVSFQSAFIGVAKTTDGLVDEFGDVTEEGLKIQEQYRAMSKEIPLAVEELLGIGEIGGQLGIAKDDLEEFTKTIAALGVSTNLTTERAATDLARIANVMGTEGAEGFSRMGSAVVELGNNFATSETEIVSFASRIAASANIAGMSESNIFAIGAAMASVGIKAEAGGTAVQKAILAMNAAVLSGGDKLEVFANTAGMEAEDFAEAWETDAGQAFASFLSGLRESGDEAQFVLGELELTDQRLTRAFLSLAKAGSKVSEEGTLLNDTMARSDEAFATNTALADEAALRYGTTESQMEMFNNTLKDIKITVGNAIIPVMTNLLELAKPLIDRFSEFASTFSESFTATFEEFGSVLWAGAAGLQNFISEEHRSKIWDFVAFIEGSLIPSLKNMGVWLIKNIPVAVKALSDAWKNILQPAIQAAWTFIQNNLVPAFNLLSDWIGGVLPIYIDYLAAQWNTMLVPIFQALALAWETQLRPAFVILGAWLQEKLPVAIAVVSAIFENVLKPAMAIIGTFIAETVIPIVAELVAWFIEHIPPAIDATADFVMNTLIPAIQDAITWVTNFIDGAKEFIDTMKTGVANAIETVADFFENTLMPPLRDVWDFIDKYVISVFEALANLTDAVLGKALEALVLIWNESLKPALLELWETISTTVNPVLEALAEMWTEEIVPAFELAWDFIVNDLVPGIRDIVEKGIDFVRPALEWMEEHLAGPMSEAFEKVGGWIEKAVEWIDKLAEAIRNIDLANILPFLGESPSPLERGLKGIGGALNELSTIRLPQFNASLATVGAPVSSAPVVSNQSYNIQVGPNTIATQQDEAIFANRVLQVVGEAIGNV